MTISIFGAGMIGATLAGHWVHSDHSVVITTRHLDRVTDLVESLGRNASAAHAEDAIDRADAILLAVPLRALPETFVPLADAFTGKVVLDAMNPFPDRDGDFAREVIAAGPSGLTTQRLLPDARVVRAFSAVYFRVLEEEAFREHNRVAIPIAGNDPEAKRTSEHLIRDAGFESYDLGGLADSAPLDPGGSLFAQKFTRDEIAAVMGVGT